MKILLMQDKKSEKQVFFDIFSRSDADQQNVNQI